MIQASQNSQSLVIFFKLVKGWAAESSAIIAL